MNDADIIERLKAIKKRAPIARVTGLPRMYLHKLAYGIIKNPGSRQMEALRKYFSGAAE